MRSSDELVEEVSKKLEEQIHLLEEQKKLSKEHEKEIESIEKKSPAPVYSKRVLGEPEMAQYHSSRLMPVIFITILIAIVVISLIAYNYLAQPKGPETELYWFDKVSKCNLVNPENNLKVCESTCDVIDYECVDGYLNCKCTKFKNPT